MSNWREVPRQPRETVDEIHLRAVSLGRYMLHVSGNLATGERVTVLTDGARLALRFSEDGAQAVRHFGRSSVRRFYLRKMAANLFPVGWTGPVPWHREGDLIVIDPRNIETGERMAAE